MTKEENLNRIHCVLTEPQDSANIGSVCRAIKTMGITHLDIVGERDYDISRLKSLSVHAFDVWENAKIYKTLDDALEGSSLSIAFTRRKGKFRKLSSWSPLEFVQFVEKFPAGVISLVFGRENNGLSDEEVEKCNAVCTIETSPEFPSLNLAQSVQIAAYMLYSNLSDYEKTEHSISKSAIDESTKNAIASLSQMHFFKEDSDEKHSYEIFIRDFLSRGGFSISEKQRIDKFFTKLSKIALYKNQQK